MPRPERAEVPLLLTAGCLFSYFESQSGVVVDGELTLFSKLELTHFLVFLKENQDLLLNMQFSKNSDQCSGHAEHVWGRLGQLAA